MSHTRRIPIIAALVVVFAGVVAVLSRLQTGLVLDAPPPRVTLGSVRALPEQALSIVAAPVTYDLGTVLDSLEAAIPITYGDIEERLPTAHNKRVNFAFHLKRSPFRLRVHGQQVTVSAEIEYSGRVWYDPTIGPEVEMSCGTGGDLPRRATLTIVSTGEMTREWGVRTHSRVKRLEAYSDSERDRCRLTFLRIDVTERVFAMTHRMLDEKLSAFDSLVAIWPARRRFEKVWRDLQKPFRLADSVYMTINPAAAELGEIGANGQTAFANLRLLAAPRVTTGPKPVLELIPLPPLERASDVHRGALVLLDASFKYPVATVHLRKALVGRRIEQSGRKVQIRDIRISGIGGGKVALGVRISGAIRGRLWFTGTPSFDPSKREILVPDLEYDVGTAQALVKGFEWLNSNALRDFLREQATIPDSAVIGRLTVLAEQGMNRALPARGTRLSGDILEAGVTEVSATLDDIRVRVIASADMRLAIDRSPSIPRPPTPGARSRAVSDDKVDED